MGRGPKRTALPDVYAQIKPKNAVSNTTTYSSNKFTGVEENYGTASKDAVKFYSPEAKANFERCFTPEVMANMNWYPTVPAGLEEMEGKCLDKIRAAK